jgi:cell shape-determining protein MreD
MTRARLAAALAALLTTLLLQASIVGPLSVPVPVSLPALVVAAIALVDGPGTGMPFGFAVGLLADLGSNHPAGVLAGCWLAVGLGCGLLRSPGATVRRDAALAALASAAAGVVAMLLLTVVHADGAGFGAAVRYAVPAVLVQALLGLVVVPVVRFFLHTPTLRAPHPVLLLGTDR